MSYLQLSCNYLPLVFQIIAPVQQVGQASSAQSPVATLVKTVSAPCVSSVTIPVTQVGPVNINVSMTGQKTATGKSSNLYKKKKFSVGFYPQTYIIGQWKSVSILGLQCIVCSTLEQVLPSSLCKFLDIKYMYMGIEV